MHCSCVVPEILPFFRKFASLSIEPSGGLFVWTLTTGSNARCGDNADKQLSSSWGEFSIDGSSSGSKLGWSWPRLGSVRLCFAIYRSSQACLSSLIEGSESKEYSSPFCSYHPQCPLSTSGIAISLPRYPHRSRRSLISLNLPEAHVRGCRRG